MSLSVCVLASSSSGNCTWISSPTTAILVDAGLSARTTAQRLAEIGADLSAVKGICVSHEHADHTAGIPVLHRRHGIPVFVNDGTREGFERDPRRAPTGDGAGVEWQVFTTGSPFGIGDLTITPFSVPHDAYEPVGFVIEHEGLRVGIATDMGMPTTLIRERLRPCRAAIVETNHDEHLLQQSARPWPLKQRILGRQGHLSNRAAAEMLASIAGPDLHQVFLAHLSSECNDAALAEREVREQLERAGHAHIRICMTFPDRVSELWRG